MENPCDKCIVKVNCTQVCFAKYNFKTLLENGIKNFHNDIIGVTSTVNLMNQYNNYRSLLIKTRTDIAIIKARINPANV